MTKKNQKEIEMREAKVPWPDTESELISYINSLINMDHDYGTCPYAMSMAAVATIYYMSNKLGASGNQASYAGLDFLRRTRDMKDGFKIIDFSYLLFPQYEIKIKGFWDLIYENKHQLAIQAKENLQKIPNAHEDVKRHWEHIIHIAEIGKRTF